MMLEMRKDENKETGGRWCDRQTDQTTNQTTNQTNNFNANKEKHRKNRFKIANVDNKSWTFSILLSSLESIVECRCGEH